MKATNFILATVITLTAVTSLAEKTDRPKLTPKEARQYIRQPYGAPAAKEWKYVRQPYDAKTVKDWKYDGWIIRGDISFYQRIVKHLQIIEECAPEMYAVGQKNVDLIVVPAQISSCAWPEEKKIGISYRELNYPLLSKGTAVIMHEFQHCDPRDGSEGAACWTAVMYGKQTGVHPCLIKFYRGVAVGPHGYSQAKWDAAHRK